MRMGEGTIHDVITQTGLNRAPRPGRTCGPKVQQVHQHVGPHVLPGLGAQSGTLFTFHQCVNGPPLLGCALRGSGASIPARHSGTPEVTWRTTGNDTYASLTSLRCVSFQGKSTGR